MKSSVRKSGIDIIGPTPWGTHFCMFYQTKDDLLDILIPYFKEGLENNEYCMWVTSEPLNEKDAEKAMRAAIPNFDKYLQKIQIEIIPYTEWYVENNKFDSQRVLNGWVDKCKFALDNGFKGLRLTGNTFWLEDKDWKDFIDYEEEVNNVISSYNMIAVCTYSLEKCGSFEILDVVRNHQYALFRREGSWEIFRSSEQTKIEQELKESEEKWRALSENSPAHVLLLDREHKIIFINRTVPDLSKEEVIGTSIFNYTPQEFHKITRDCFYSVWETGEPSSITTKYITKEGDIRYFDMWVGPVFQSEKIVALITHSMDITERKKKEEKIRLQSEIIENMSKGVNLIKLDDGTIVFTNPTFEEMFGYNPGEMIGKNVAIINAPTEKTPEETREKIMGILKEAGEWHGEVLNVKKDGTPFWCYSNVSLFDHPEYGTVSVSIHTDITERKKVEQKLRDSEKKVRMNEDLFRDFFDNAATGFHIFSPDRIITDMNKYELDLLGYSLEEIVDKKTWYDLIIPENRYQFEKHWNEILDKGSVNNLEYTLIHKDGHFVDVLLSASMRFDEKGNLINTRGSVIDITKRRQVEQALRESEEKFRLIAEQTLIGINITQNKIIKYINKAFADMHEYSVEEMYEWTLNDLVNNVHPDDLPLVREMAKSRETGDKNIHHFSFRTITKSKKIKWLDIVSRFIQYEGKDALLSTITDITELKEIEKKLKESKHDLGERVKELTCLYGLSKLIENPVISLEDIINGTLNLILPAWQLPDITTARIIYDGREYKLGNFEETEWKLSTKVNINEKQLLIEVYYLEYKPLLKEEQDLIREIGIRLKVTLEEKEAQNRLRESEEKYRMGFESSTDGIASTDMEGTFLDFNNVFLEMLGYSRKDLLKLSFREITPQIWHEMEDNMIISQLADEKDSGIYEKEYIRKDGTILPINIRFWIIKDDQGDPVRMWKIVRDITERKKAEEEIANLAKFPSEDPYPVLRVNKNRVIYVNDSGKNLLKVKENDEIPMILQKEINEAFESNSITESEVKLKNRFYSFAITPLIEKGYVNIYGMDITDKKQVEQKLKEVNKLKSEFLRRASHELKTPLISIKGFSDLILALHKDQINPDVISKLNEINQGCERLQNIINNLLTTSRLESPDLKPKVQREDLTFLIKFCVHELQSLAQTRNQIINLDIQDGQYAIFEKEEIHDVISNLLTNAIKYTPPNGKIEVRTDIQEKNLVISVKDNGIGFTNDEKKKIFQQFGKIERYGQGLDLGIDGTGLGLYISKRIVESHGGKIWMESEGKNKGSTFYFSLPLIPDTV